MGCCVSSPLAVTKPSALKCSFLLSICTLIYNDVGKFCAHRFAEYLLTGNLSVCSGTPRRGGSRSAACVEEDLVEPMLFQISIKVLWSFQRKSGSWYILVFIFICESETETSLACRNKSQQLLVEGQCWCEQGWEPVLQPSCTLPAQCCQQPLKEPLAE